jgi:hypothetical protein
LKSLIRTLRSQAIGILALFIALAGTGYAAITLPAGSVGARQIKNHSIAAVKLDGRSIAGYVAFWARINSQGVVLASSTPTRTAFWSSGVGHISFRARLSHDCFPLTSSGGDGAPGGIVTVLGLPNPGFAQTFGLSMERPTGVVTPLAVDIAEICP